MAEQTTTEAGSIDGAASALDDELSRRPMPCPFCGGTRIGTHHKRSGRKAGYQSMCLTCKIGQTGTYHGSIEQSVRAWNRRANV